MNLDLVEIINQNESLAPFSKSLSILYNEKRLNNDLYMDASLRTQACSLNYRNGNSRPENSDDVDKNPFA